MSSSRQTPELIEFPCHFEYKVFGPGNDASFIDSVQSAVSSVVLVSRDAMRQRNSSGGKYQCVSVLVSLQNRRQLDKIYARLRLVDGLKYIL